MTARPSLFPGVVLVGHVLGGDGVPAALAYALMAAAFVLLPPTIATAFAQHRAGGE